MGNIYKDILYMGNESGSIGPEGAMGLHRVARQESQIAAVRCPEPSRPAGP